jgi:hypothetical protein
MPTDPPDCGCKASFGASERASERASGRRWSRKCYLPTRRSLCRCAPFRTDRIGWQYRTTGFTYIHQWLTRPELSSFKTTDALGDLVEQQRRTSIAAALGSGQRLFASFHHRYRKIHVWLSVWTDWIGTGLRSCEPPKNATRGLRKRRY